MRYRAQAAARRGPGAQGRAQGLMPRISSGHHLLGPLTSADPALRRAIDDYLGGGEGAPMWRPAGREPRRECRPSAGIFAAEDA